MRKRLDPTRRAAMAHRDTSLEYTTPLGFYCERHQENRKSLKVRFKGWPKGVWLCHSCITDLIHLLVGDHPITIVTGPKVSS